MSFREILSRTACTRVAELHCDGVVVETYELDGSTIGLHERAN